jgi:predicted negative regulator of RcsB-dependent stress response
MRLAEIANFFSLALIIIIGMGLFLGYQNYQKLQKEVAK